MQETEFAYKRVNSLQENGFDEEWEREERKERFTFMIFGVLIVVLILAIISGVFFLMQIEGTKALNSGIERNDSSVGNMTSPDISGNGEFVVTPQLMKPEENVSGNQSQASSEEVEDKSNNDMVDVPGDMSEFMIYDSDIRYLVSADLNELTAWEIRVARNEIYARHGRMFDSVELKEYFESKSWYVPKIPAVEFNISCLNNVELENLNFIINYEKAHNLN